MRRNINQIVNLVKKIKIIKFYLLFKNIVMN